MHDPKFEKQVQQRMEELEFSPSEGVWVNLQRELHKEKRRRAPLLWLFFLLGGVLLGAGGTSLLFFHGSSSPTSPSPVTNPAPATTPATRISQGKVAQGAIAGTHSSDGMNINAARLAPGRPPHTGVGRPTSAMASYQTLGITRSGNREQQTGIPETDQPEHQMKETGQLEPGTPETKQSEPGMQGTVQPDPTTPGMASVTAALAPVQGDPGEDPATDLNRISLPAAGKPHALYTVAGKPATQSARLAHASSWEAGFAGGFGRSSISMTHAPSPAPSGLSVLPRVTQINGLTSGAAPQQINSISDMQPDLSYWAGIFVQKPVFKKLSLSVGLNLHYYSTRLQTGQKVPDNPNLSTASLFTASAYVQPAGRFYPAYAPGTNYEYTNRYYFLEVPVSLQWQFNHSRKTPLFWEGGLSFSRLMSVDALYYNEKSRVYYKDGQVANPTQFMAFSSLMVGLSWKGNLVRFGPELQYGLNSLVNPNSTGAQHLFYGGIKLTVIPKKW